MKTNSIIQQKKRKFKDLLIKIHEASKCDFIGFASAYCTVSGVRKLENIIINSRKRQIVVGLDDYITHPSAIKIMQNCYGCAVRVAGVNYTGRKFHPKVFFLGSNSPRKHNTLVIGSANLTRDGLLNNIEAVTVVESENTREKIELLDVWKQIWKIGQVPDTQLLNQYEKKFKLNRKKFPKKKSKANTNILESDDAIVDPSCACTCWIEVGKITGFQAEQLEIKAEQALFFDLPSCGGADTDIRVRLKNGSQVAIPTKYRENAMWRFNLPDSIPEVHAGLRPRGLRSPYVAVFTKNNNIICLKFIKFNSSKFRKLKEESKENGTLGKTTTRLYGWF